MIFDLYNPTEPEIPGYGQIWKVSGSTSSYTSRGFMCGSNGVMGINGRVLTSADFIERTYPDLSTHNFVTFSMEIVFIDNWGPSDSVSMYFDDQLVTTWTPANNMATYNQPICGDTGTLDLKMVVLGKRPHTGNSLKLRFELDIQSTGNIAGIGVYNVGFTFPASLSATQDIYTCYGGSCDFPGKTCLTNEYNNAGTCTACDGGCTGCWGGDAGKCYRCASGRGFDGTNCFGCTPSTCLVCTSAGTCQRCRPNRFLPLNKLTCPTATCADSTTIVQTLGSINYCFAKCPAGQFVMPDYTCGAACDSPLTIRIVGDVNYCDYPCDPTQEIYHYWNTSCLNTCPYSKRLTSIGNFCDACADPSHFLYENKTCLPTCQLNFLPTNAFGFKFCNFPCPIEQYLYSNGTCHASCQIGFNVRMEGSYQFCDFPCQLSDFLYPNTTCHSTCQPLFSTRTEVSFKFCDFPCQTSQYLYPNSTCHPSCQTGFNTRTEFSFKFCDFPCQLTEFLYPNNTCHSTCQLLFTPRTEGSFKFCDFPCQLSQYLYPNSTCHSTCQSLFIPRTEFSFKFCSFPCQLNQFIYHNGSCLPTCQSLFTPRTEGSFQFCDFPCQTSQYLYQNGSCYPTCQPLFISRTEFSFKFCTFPCTTSTDYLFNNGSCRSSCPSPLIPRTEGTYQFCSLPCPPAQFFYQNSSCFPYCTQYFKQITYNDVNFCNFPCQSDYLLSWNGSCSPTCDLPYQSNTISGNKHCYLPCPTSSHYLFDDNSCSLSCSGTKSIYDFVVKICKGPFTDDDDELQRKVNQTAEIIKSGNTAASAGLTALKIISPTNPSSTTSTSIKQMLEYLRYLDIKQSEKLKRLFNVSSPDPSDFIPDPEVLQKLKAELPDRSLPTIFMKYELNSSFLKNFGDKIIFLLILSTALLVVSLLNWACKWLRNIYFIRSLVKRTKFVLQNFLVGKFYESFGQIIFYSGLEFQSFSSDSAYSALSLAFAITCLTIGFVVLGINYWLINKYQGIKTSGQDPQEVQKKLEKFEEKYKGLGLLFEDFKDSTFHQQAFMFYSVLRSCVFNIIIVCLWAFPLTQVFMIVFLSFVMLWYLVFKAPLKSRLEFIQQLCFEIALMVVNVSFFVLAISERTSGNSESISDHISELVIVFNVIYTFLPLSFLVIRSLITMWEWWKIVQELQRRSKKSLRFKGFPHVQKAERKSLQHENDISGSNLLKGQKGSFSLEIEDSSFVRNFSHGYVNERNRNVQERNRNEEIMKERQEDRKRKIKRLNRPKRYPRNVIE